MGDQAAQIRRVLLPHLTHAQYSDTQLAHPVVPPDESAP
jgi:hypothetical protein